MEWLCLSVGYGDENKMVLTILGELLIGEGFWLGLLIIISLLFLLTYVIPFFAWIGSIFCMFLFFYYSSNLPPNDFRLWGMLMIAVTPIFLILVGYKSKD